MITIHCFRPAAAASFSYAVEVEAVTHAIQWLASQHDAQITHAIIFTDLMNLLQKVGSGMCCPDWNTAMHSGSTVLGTAESVGISGQIDWQAQQISHLVCSLAGQRCSEAWGTFWTWTGQSITALITWRKEEWRKEAADIPLCEVKNDLCSTRQILALFRRQPWGDCWETGWSAYGPFRALRCHLELKLKLKLGYAVSTTSIATLVTSWLLLLLLLMLSLFVLSLPVALLLSLLLLLLLLHQHHLYCNTHHHHHCHATITLPNLMNSC